MKLVNSAVEKVIDRDGNYFYFCHTVEVETDIEDLSIITPRSIVFKFAEGGICISEKEAKGAVVRRLGNSNKVTFTRSLADNRKIELATEPISVINYSDTANFWITGYLYPFVNLNCVQHKFYKVALMSVIEERFKDCRVALVPSDFWGISVICAEKKEIPDSVILKDMILPFDVIRAISAVHIEKGGTESEAIERINKIWCYKANIFYFLTGKELYYSDFTSGNNNVTVENDGDKYRVRLAVNVPVLFPPSTFDFLGIEGDEQNCISYDKTNYKVITPFDPPKVIWSSLFKYYRPDPGYTPIYLVSTNDVSPGRQPSKVWIEEADAIGPEHSVLLNGEGTKKKPRIAKLGFTGKPGRDHIIFNSYGSPVKLYRDGLVTDTERYKYKFQDNSGLKFTFTEDGRYIYDEKYSFTDLYNVKQGEGEVIITFNLQRYKSLLARYGEDYIGVCDRLGHPIKVLYADECDIQVEGSELFPGSFKKKPVWMTRDGKIRSCPYYWKNKKYSIYLQYKRKEA